MSLARYLSKLGALLNSDGKVPSGALASGAARANFGAGAVLQVVQVSTSTQTGTTGSSYVNATNLAASITPSSSSSKILVLVDYSTYTQSDNSINMGVRVLRDGASAIWEDAAAHINNVNANVAIGTRNSILKLDSPATTNSVTYQVQIKRTSVAGTGYAVYINGNTANTSTITLVEIAG